MSTLSVLLFLLMLVKVLIVACTTASATEGKNTGKKLKPDHSINQLKPWLKRVRNFLSTNYNS